MMRRYPVTLVAVVTAAALAICFLLLELRAERNETARLREQLREATQAGGLAAPARPLANGSSPSLVPVVQEAPPTASTPAAIQPAARPLTLSRTMIPKALGLTAGEKDAFLRLFERGGSYWDFVALIGEAKYEQYLAIRRSTAREEGVRALRTLLVATDYPLTDVQAAQLHSLLEADLLRRAAEDKYRVRPSEPLALLDYDEARLQSKQAGADRVVAAARSFLRAEQAVVLQGQLNGPLRTQLDRMRTRRAELNAAVE